MTGKNRGSKEFQVRFSSDHRSYVGPIILDSWDMGVSLNGGTPKTTPKETPIWRGRTRFHDNGRDLKKSKIQ